MYLLHPNNHFLFPYFIFFILSEISLLLEYKLHKEKFCFIHYCILCALKSSENPLTVQKKGNAKQCSNYRTIALISHASKVMLKILQAKLQQYMNSELPAVQEQLEPECSSWF